MPTSLPSATGGSAHSSIARASDNAFAAAREIQIVSPADGATVSGPDVTITLNIGDLKLVPGAQATKQEDPHIHYLLDVDPAPWLDGKRDLPTGDPNIVHAAATAHTFKNITPGPHTITIILTDSNHVATLPPVAPTASFTVAGDVSWTAKAQMPTSRYDLGVVAVDGKIYAIGGFDGSKHLATVEEFDPATNAWTAKASMPTARHDFGTAVANNGKIYVIGGFDGSARLATVEEYDPATNIWTTKANLPTARSALGAAAASNGKIYAIGGCGGSLCERLSTVEEYDPATNTWTTKANLPTARSALGVATASNGKVYAIGGCEERLCERLALVEEYDPATNVWSVKASMPTPRDSLGAVATNGKIYAVGGFDGASRLATVEEYDPGTNIWASKASMPTARSGLGVVAFGDDKIYAIGGYGGGTGTVEEATLSVGQSQPPAAGAQTKPAAVATTAPANPPAGTGAAPVATTVAEPSDTGLLSSFPLIVIILGVAVIGGVTIVAVAFVVTRNRGQSPPVSTPTPAPTPAPLAHHSHPPEPWANRSPAPPSGAYPNASPAPMSAPWPSPAPAPGSWPSSPPVNIQSGGPVQPTVAAWDQNAAALGGQNVPFGYQIVSPPKYGGMASVYKAYQPALDRYVALKVMLPHLASDPAFVQRFYEEARRTAKLDHPNIVTIHDIGQLPNGSLFITMRFIEGISLQELLARDGRLAVDRASHVSIEVARALEYAHQQGIIHRDVKPSNIMVEPGDRVTLTDFGIAKLLGDLQLTRPGAVVGTPKYLSPEQATGEPIDHRSDIYALGLVLYELLAGRAPFESETPSALLHAHITQPPRPPTEFNAQIPPALEAVVLKALVKDRTLRYQSAREFIQGVQQVGVNRES